MSPLQRQAALLVFLVVVVLRSLELAYLYVPLFFPPQLAHTDFLPPIIHWESMLWIALDLNEYWLSSIFQWAFLGLLFFTGAYLYLALQLPSRVAACLLIVTFVGYDLFLLANLLYVQYFGMGVISFSATDFYTSFHMLPMLLSYAWERFPLLIGRFVFEIPVVFLVVRYWSVLHLGVRQSKRPILILIAVFFLIRLALEWQYFALGRSFIHLAQRSGSETGLSRPDFRARAMLGYGPILGANIIFPSVAPKARKFDGYPETIVSGLAKGTKRNILVIQMETLGSYGPYLQVGSKVVMPYLRSLLTTSRAYDLLTYHYRGTQAVEYSVLNSTEPPIDFLSSDDRDALYKNSIVHRLRREGYETRFLHNGLANIYRRATQIPQIGFQYTEFDVDISARLGLPSRRSAFSTPDHLAVDYLIDQMDDWHEPFFVMWMTISAHAMFDSSKAYWKETFPEVGHRVTRNLFSSLRYDDEQIKRLVKAVREKYPDAVIMIYGDHPYYYDAWNEAAENTDQDMGPFVAEAVRLSQDRDPLQLTYEYVPVFMLDPKAPNHRETRYAAVLPDISVTILEASGIPYSIRSFGQNLLAALTNDEVPYRRRMISRDEAYRIGQEHTNQRYYKKVISN